MSTTSSSSSAAITDAVTTGSSSSTLVSININNITKLSSTNYLMWNRQIHSLLRGYDLLAFIDPSHERPAETVTVDGKISPNPAYSLWLRQDNLLYSAIIGSIEVAHQPLIAAATTSLEAWTTLASTYAKPSRGHIRQLKDQLKFLVKNTKTIDEYMQFIKTKFDVVALLGNPYHPEDLTDIVLAGLPDDYKPVIDAVHGRNVPISFAELHEKLINRESHLLNQPLLPSPFPVTANAAQNRPQHWNHSTPSSVTSKPCYSSHTNHRLHSSGQRKPYLGKCQACGVQGHTAQKCTQFRIVSSGQNPLPRGFSPSQPQAYHALTGPNESPSWLVDTGASHHITSDLANLSLHSPYNGSEEVVIGDGKGLAITHTGEGSQLGGTGSNKPV
ncbi:PREDICTED: uncharacterized protein LOC104726746 [Camelina sativa]|uniref:Uncharacterized protein LOC104726746 n=1 Tax=Camelina sativa TaxID=90675 RepID=A0ABM0UP21_CAMSA|nr:PREDICTED: uncharacterized protein LOC104726746 [Camelina sativa]